MNHTPPCLQVCHLAKSYSGQPILRDVSLEVFPGEILGLLGPNGAGKTTAFYILVGLIAPDSGEVRFHNKNITHLPVHKRAKMGMGYLAQEPSLFPELTVEENLLCILETLPLTRSERTLRLTALLEELHLTPLAKKRGATLSGGERRRLEITRSLITQPTLLLLDEPFANIDPRSIEEVQNLISLLAKRGISIVITDHNAREIFLVVDRCCLLDRGEVLFVGTPEECARDEKTRSIYLGSHFELLPGRK